MRLAQTFDLVLVKGEKEMCLKEFIAKFVCRNTLIRLWTPVKGGHKMLSEEENSVCMEWELLQDKVWQSKYNNFIVVGVKDIIVNDFYKEAVNIVIIT